MPLFTSPSRRLFSGKHRHAFAALLFFLGIPLIPYSAWVLKAMSHRSGEIPHTGKGARPVRFSDLKPGERILIDLSSSGCRHYRQYQLVFDGARSEVLVTLKSHWSSGSVQDDTPRFLGGLPLTAQELAGFDRFLDLIRENRFHSTSLDTIRIERFHDDARMGSEQFCDGIGLNYAFEEDDKGRIVFSDRGYGRIPGSSELLSLGMIIRRVEKQAEQEANKSKAAL